MDRRTTLLSMFDVSGFGLEIGPSYNPLMRKADGFNIETLDYADQATLVAKYATTRNVDVSRIEVVDHVSDGRPMAEIIGKRHCYDFIIASHVIEHTPDLVGFLANCEELLTENGRLILAVPDKRSCFDVFQNLTSTGDVLEAHRQGRTRPGTGSLFDAAAYGATRDGQIGWQKAQCDKREIYQPLSAAYNLVKKGETDQTYIDVHVWRFVPASFELILNDLSEGGHTGLRICEMHCDDEMLVSLDRTGTPGRRSRLELMEAILDEQAISSLQHAALLVELESAKTALESTKAELESAKAELARVGGDLTSTRDETARRDAELAEMRSQLAAATSELQGSFAARDDLARQLDARDRDIAALHRSRSWRVTQPLRSVSTFLIRDR